MAQQSIDYSDLLRRFHERFAADDPLWLSPMTAAEVGNALSLPQHSRARRMLSNVAPGRGTTASLADFEVLLKQVCRMVDAGVTTTAAGEIAVAYLGELKDARVEAPTGPQNDPVDVAQCLLRITELEDTLASQLLRISELEDTTGFLAQQAVDDADQLVADAETTLKERRGLAEIRRAYQRALGAYRSEIPDN